MAGWSDEGHDRVLGRRAVSPHPRPRRHVRPPDRGDGRGGVSAWLEQTEEAGDVAASADALAEYETLGGTQADAFVARMIDEGRVSYEADGAVYWVELTPAAIRLLSPLRSWRWWPSGV
jgi:hypothetical protein